jgi:hypothetical protein
MHYNINEIKRLEEKISFYKTQVSQGSFNLSIIFESNTSKMNFIDLLTKEVHHYNSNDFTVIYLNPYKVSKAIASDFEKVYSKTELFAMSEGIKTARLIEFIEAGNKIIPPIIEPIHNNLAIRDGNHRLGLMCYLNMVSAPFLVKTNLVGKINNLI